MLIVVTADHGEGMGEHDYYFAHGENLYEHQIHVPLILHYGDRFQGRRSDPVQHVDVVPTILAIIGADLDPRLRGQDLRKTSPASREHVAEANSLIVRNGRKSAVISDNRKLVMTGRARRVELYDLADDPEERRNLAGDPTRRKERVDLALRLRALVREDRLGLDLVPRPEITEEERAKLRALGYAE